MARSLISMLLVGLLVVCLAFSVVGADLSYDFDDSGEKVFAAPPMAMAPAALAVEPKAVTKGTYGYNYSPCNNPFTNYINDKLPTSVQYQFVFPSGSVWHKGIYSFTATFDSKPTGAVFWYNAANHPGTFTRINGNTCEVIVPVTSEFSSNISLAYSFPLNTDMHLLSYDFKLMTPVDGISSGFTYNSGAISDRDHSKFQTITASFGNQPAGDYLINVYHWGDSCDPTFALTYGGRRLASSTDGGVTTATVSHGGGDLMIGGNVNIVRSTDWDTIGGFWSGGGNDTNISGSIITDSPGSWTFNIVDIVAVPLEGSSVEQFGIFGPLVGFFRDQYSNFTGFMTGLMDKYFKGENAPEMDQSTSEAGGLADQQQQANDQILGGFDDAAGQVNPSTITIPNDVISGFSLLSNVFMMVFNGLGNYQVLVTVPLCIGIALICTGRGFNAAGRSMSAASRRSRSSKGGSSS